MSNLQLKFWRGERFLKYRGGEHRASFIRGFACYITLNHTESSLTMLAEYCNKSQSTISRSIKKVGLKIKNDEDLQASVVKVLNHLIED